jgi:acyl-CoA synthetase (NDP forming)
MAVQASLERLFNPRSIAIVGASSEGPTSYVAANLRGLGYGGALYPVNPSRASVWDLPAHAGVLDLPEVPDLSLIAVGAGRVRDAVAGSLDAGVKSLMIYSAGMAETGEDGARIQDEVLGLASAADATVLGPNCLGFVNVTDRVALSAFPPQSMPAEMRAGGVGVVSQSGGLMISVMELGTRLGLRFSRLLSTGNEADVTSLDCLEYLIDDPATSVIGFVLERVSGGRRLLELARRAAERGKPIVALRLGRSTLGRQAALTHTASVVGPASEFAAAAASVGITVASTPSELVSHLMMFAKRRDPAARRPGTSGGVAVVTMSGGTRVMVADVADDHGVDLVPLGEGTRRRIAAVLPDFAAIDNPLDLTPAGVADPVAVDAAIRAVADDAAVSTIALVLHLKNSGGSPVQQALIRRFCEVGAELQKQFVVISSIPEGLSGYWSETVAESAVPFLNDLSGFASLAALDRWRRRASELAAAGAPAGPDLSGAGAGAGAVIAPGPLDEAASYRLLDTERIPVLAWRLAPDLAAATSAAADLGYPVVLKICSPAIAHKSDVGGVVTGIGDPRELSEAWEAIRRATTASVPAAAEHPMIVQSMGPAGGIELLIGTMTSADFGPLISVGLGGIWTELLDDVIVRPCPLDVADAGAMLDSLRASAVLDGARGRPAVDRVGVAQVIAAVSRLAAREAATVAAIEINPLIADAVSASAADALVILHDIDGVPNERTEGR